MSVTQNKLLLFIVTINIIILMSIEKPVSDTTMSSTYGSSTVAYAQQRQQEKQPVARTQEWVDKQSNTKVLFTYSPDKPLSGMLTELIFDTLNLKTGIHFKDVLATVTIIDGAQQQVPIKFSNISAPDGHFSIKYRFAHEGIYQIIVKMNSNYFALTLASFKVVVPFQPFGVFNTSLIFPLLIPVVLIAIIGAMGIIAFIIIVNRKQK
jgi:hypothetical protein